MRTLKKAKQMNVEISIDMYCDFEIQIMLRNKEIFYLDGCKQRYDYNAYSINTVYRVFLENIKEIKVILDEYGYYRNVAIGNNGKQYFITL